MQTVYIQPVQNNITIPQHYDQSVTASALVHQFSLVFIILLFVNSMCLQLNTAIINHVLPNLTL